ncbi:uncharacterized protein LOC122920503 [Bufo gargarizans]|uniref:uncharacterized protein LOC122920503 n=1 Tax=Bufo gargarizans TaxID=30331 RepID=UPI001CF20D44|nr:uncharacterized protein LOC122920503 [Bufo gargarizans]
MGLQNFIVPWIFYLTCEVTSAGTENLSRMQEHNLEYTMSTTISNATDPSDALVVKTHIPNFQDSNLVWTDFMTDGQFGQFRFGIGLSPDLSSNVTEATSSLLHIRASEKLFVTVTAETNRSDVRLVITSCKLVSKKNKTKSYFIQDGCLDNKMVENISREDTKMVFTLHLSGVAQLSGPSMVFISCEVKLCLDSNHSGACASYCPVQFSEQPIGSLLETRTYHIFAKPVYVTQKTRKKATTNYAAVVIGMVLGGTVLAVVLLLVRKSFSGLRRRNILMDL